MPWSRALLFGAGMLVTGSFAAGLTPGLLRAITRAQGVGPGSTEGVFAWGLSAYFFWSLVHHVLTAGLTLPSFEVGLADFLDAFARGWGLGLTVLGARVIGESLRSFGAPSANGSYFADAFFFLVVFLILSTPGLFAAALAKWLR